MATVEDGVVTGVGYGTAIITATSHNGLTDSCLVTVAIPTEEIHISVASGEKAEVGVDSSNLTLRATALGPNDTSENVPQEFNWMSSNSQIAQVRVHFDGSCSVRGLRTGTVQIYALCQGRYRRARRNHGARHRAGHFLLMEPATANLFVGGQLQLRANGTPSNATYHEPADFTWETSDEKVATVSETALVTGVGEGRGHHHRHFPQCIQATCSVKVTIPVGQIDIELVDAERPDVGIGTAGLRVRAIAYDADGSTTTVSQDIDWRVSNPNYIRIIDNGGRHGHGHRPAHRHCPHWRPLPPMAPMSAPRWQSTVIVPVESFGRHPHDPPPCVRPDAGPQGQRHAHQRYLPHPC